MELINQTKTNFVYAKGKKGETLIFKIGEVRTFNEEIGKTLLRYEGINDLASLKVKEEKAFNAARAQSPASASEYQLLKEEAESLELEFASNISKANLEKLVEEAKADSDSEGE